MAEGLPLSVLEAMSSSLPIVASNIDGLPDAVIDGENGFLIKDHKIKAYVEALEVLISRQEKREEMGSKSLSHYKEHFTEEKFRESVAKLFQ